MPLRAVHALGSLLGTLGCLILSRERRVTEVNLGIAFSELDERERRRLARRSMIETARTMVELGAVWTWSNKRVLGLVREAEGEDAVREVLDSGRGVILALPHLGCWELVGQYYSSSYRMTGLYRAPRIRELEEFFRSSRERFGARLVPAGAAAVRAIRRALKRGESVAILPDQDAGEGVGIFVPFFGMLANTMILISRLAAKRDCAVFITYAERLPSAAGFRMHFVPASEGVYDADLERSATCLNRDIERCVRSLPDQYLWSYKRFRIRPAGTPDPYRVPESVTR